MDLIPQRLGLAHAKVRDFQLHPRPVPFQGSCRHSFDLVGWDSIVISSNRVSMLNLKNLVLGKGFEKKALQQSVFYANTIDRTRSTACRFGNYASFGQLYVSTNLVMRDIAEPAEPIAGVRFSDNLHRQP